MMRHVGSLPYFFALLACVACGGGVATGLAPRTAASVAPSSPATATVPAQTSATPAPTATPPVAASTSPVPTVSASASPVAAATSDCTNVNAGSMNETWTLDGEALTIPLPPDPPWAGTIAFPANNPTGTVVSETVDQSNFNYAPTSSANDPAYASRTKDFFMTFRLSQPTTLGSGTTALLPITLVSSCLTGGTTYFIDAFAGSTFQYAESAVASTGSVTVHIEVTPDPFPAGIYINAILSH